MLWLSSDITENERSIEYIKDEIKAIGEKFVNNHVFSNYLENAIYGNGAVKYILSEYANETLSYEDYKDIQVEHIFAKDPNFDVSTYNFTEDYDYEKNRLGNLGLLEQTLNKGLGNIPPINKVSGYVKSRITETRNLSGEIQKGNFSKKNVDSRRAQIIDFCIKRFKY